MTTAINHTRNGHRFKTAGATSPLERWWNGVLILGGTALGTTRMVAERSMAELRDAANKNLWMLEAHLR